ncbi:hypothetical protein BJ875DRAFT_246068 [Amylocarpus encephaloides]|uniref:N-acetyltransferase domain-containing protein n=1 Tax=Amylocarpus encephaloides TaxID=45428 RepID=A0A9P7YN23_9HELO|nr:hypothetical protein BJ875DRAFT_246068 [Amylocarpus encephaloides]
MDTNATDPPPQRSAQPSIRSFFQRRSSPSYTTPPPPPLPTLSNATALPIPPKSTTKYALPPASKPRPNVNFPSQAAIGRIEEQHLQPLRRINALLLPISYPDSFYHDILAASPMPNFSRIITWTDNAPNSEPKVIGGIVCRLDPSTTPDYTSTNPSFVSRSYDIYIKSLVLLSPYRGKGLAAAVLEDVISSAASTLSRSSDFRIESLYAHVWTENKDALEWYTKRRFISGDPLVVGYYTRLKPNSAWIMRRRIPPFDYRQLISTNAAPAPISPPSELPTSSIQPESSEKKENLGSRPPISSARSFQDRGPEREWNDLPEDVLGGSLLKPPSQLASADASKTSSRSSSRSGTAGKKKRVYPTAAFGS